MDARREETDCVRRAASCASFLPLNPRPPPPVARRSSLSAPSRPTARQFIVDVWGGARPVCRRDPPASPSIYPPLPSCLRAAAPPRKNYHRRQFFTDLYNCLPQLIFVLCQLLSGYKLRSVNFKKTSEYVLCHGICPVVKVSV